VKSDIEWRKWGEIDPLYAVATWSGKSKDASNPWKDEEFYELGRSDWANFKRHWVHYGVEQGTCLEIGCGAGRITKHLAGDFHIVKAFDVSEGMINYAKQRVIDSNVEFLLAAGGQLPVGDGSVDAVFSTHVFQHFDHMEQASKYFHEIHRVLTNNGSMMIHLPIYEWPEHSGIHRMLRGILKSIDDARASYSRFLIQHGRWRPLMRFLLYELHWLYQSLDDVDFTDVQVRIIRLKSNNAPHPFVFARKSIQRSEVE